MRVCAGSVVLAWPLLIGVISLRLMPERYQGDLLTLVCRCRSLKRQLRQVIRRILVTRACVSSSSSQGESGAEGSMQSADSHTPGEHI